MAKNYEEAVREVSEEFGFSVEQIVDEEIVMEVEAEDNDWDYINNNPEADVWVTWVYKESGEVVLPGTYIGYIKDDGLSEVFTPYEQYKDQDEA